VRRSSLSTEALNAENAGIYGKHSGPAAHPLLSKHAFYNERGKRDFDRQIAYRQITVEQKNREDCE